MPLFVPPAFIHETPDSRKPVEQVLASSQVFREWETTFLYKKYHLKKYKKLFFIKQHHLSIPKSAMGDVVNTSKTFALNIERGCSLASVNAIKVLEFEDVDSYVDLDNLLNDFRYRIISLGSNGIIHYADWIDKSRFMILGKSENEGLVIVGDVNTGLIHYYLINERYMNNKIPPDQFIIKYWNK